MKRRIYPLLIAVLLTGFAAAEPATTGAAPSRPGSEPLQWLSIPNPAIELHGLPWFGENTPELWRLPKSAQPRVPVGVWRRAVAPDGGRLRFASTTSRLVLRVQTAAVPAKPCHVDAYVDAEYAGSARLTGPGPAELTLFAGRGRDSKNITLYLPNNHEIRVLAVGVDPGAVFAAPLAFARKAPLVGYGSSVLQGTGANHPAKTYPAALARRLNLDFVNLGFGGAGKAEPAVVDLVRQLDACCFIFDLGKSYGDQSGDAFVRMLAAIRQTHPTVPILCVTPIYSTREPTDAAYREKSERLRRMMRDAARERRQSGDKFTFVAEGLELFGEADKSLFRDPQHPNDEGNELIARRLHPIVEKLVFGRN